MKQRKEIYTCFHCNYTTHKKNNYECHLMRFILPTNFEKHQPFHLMIYNNLAPL